MSVAWIYTSPWTPERVAHLKQMHADGFSFSQMAETIDGGFTRNACIGKAKRLHLTRDCVNPSKQKSGRPRKKRIAKPILKIIQRLQRTNSYNGDMRIVETVETDMPEPDPSHDAIPRKQRRTLFELEPNDCRWPCGDPCDKDFFFCGGSVVPDKPYCRVHYRIAYRRGAAVVTIRPQLTRRSQREAAVRDVLKRAAAP